MFVFQYQARPLDPQSCADTNPAAYNLTNVTTSCLVTAPPSTSTNSTAPKSICNDPDSYLFWDNAHPTAKGHELLASGLASLLSLMDLLPSNPSPPPRSGGHIKGD